MLWSIAKRAVESKPQILDFTVQKPVISQIIDASPLSNHLIPRGFALAFLALNLLIKEA